MVCLARTAKEKFRKRFDRKEKGRQPGSDSYCDQPGHNSQPLADALVTVVSSDPTAASHCWSSLGNLRLMGSSAVISVALL